MPDFARRMACIVLATVLMGARGCRHAGRWLTMSPDGNASSIRSLTIMAILVVCGVAVYAGVLRLFGVVRSSTRPSARIAAEQ